MARSKPKVEPTTREQLAELERDELESLAKKRGVTVRRGDGEDGEPLKEDFVATLAGARRSKLPPKYVDAKGRPVNEDGERIDERGNVLEDEG